MINVNLQAIKKVHFIGIGGIGVSAIARMFQAEGKEVSGSDRGATLVTDELEKLGVKIYNEQVADNVPTDADLIIYSIAVPEDNPERARGRELGIPELSYPEILGLVSKDKYTIAVSGTHGKTTTTAMIGKILIDADYDPTLIVGSLMKDEASNFVAGTSKYFVVEACEYRRSFLNLSPSILVITNIDNDHLDYYHDLADIQSAFRSLAEKVPSDGFIICNPTDPNVAPVLKGLSCTIIDYTTYVTEAISLTMPGAHNRSNAGVALAVAQCVHVDPELAVSAVNNFAGTWRRFEYMGETKTGALVYDDYAHHPHEIQATLAGAREKWPTQKIVVIFQPHLYSRTKLLLDEFAVSFNDADEVITVPIYAAREPIDSTISHEILAQEIAKHHVNVRAVSSLDEAIKQVITSVKTGDIILTMGAGDIAEVGKQLL